MLHAVIAYLACRLPNCWAARRRIYEHLHSRRCLLLPCASCVPSLQDLPPATFVAPLSPRAGPYFLIITCSPCMAGLSTPPLWTTSVIGILISLLRRAPYPPPSDPASQHRTGIVSSSLDPGSPAGRLSSSLAHCHYFGFGFGQSSGPVFGQGLFLSGFPATAAITARLRQAVAMSNAWQAC